MTSNFSGQINFTTETPFNNTTSAFEDETDSSSSWHVYRESVFIGSICVLGILGNVLAIRNAVAMVQYAKQNSVIAFSLSISDLLICLVRGPSIAYVLYDTEMTGRQLVCHVWMFSTIFVLISVMTNMIVAIERYIILNSFHRYVKLFTPTHMLVLFASLWLGLAGIFTAVYIGFGYYPTVIVTTGTCAFHSHLSFMTPVYSFIICVVVVVVLGLVPLLVLMFCYVSIVHKICKAGLLRLDKLEEKVNYTKVTYISCARTVLTLCCWTPFLVFAVVSPLYPDRLNIHIVDYILIIQSAVCPFLTMQDNDFRESFSRRKSRYFSVFLAPKVKREVNPIRRSNISSADLKTM